MQNIFTPFLSYSPFSLFFFVQTILSSTPKNHPTQPSPNHPIFPSYITIYPLQYTLTFSYKSNTKKKKKKKSSNCTPPPPQFWKRAENCKFFSSTVERQRTRSNSASLDKPFFFFFFFFFGRVETLPGRACIFNSRLSAPLHPLFHRRKKEKKRDVSTRERVRASVVVGWKYGSPLITSYAFHEIFARTPHVLTLVPASWTLHPRVATGSLAAGELVWAPVQFVAFYLHTCKWYLR